MRTKTLVIMIGVVSLVSSGAGRAGARAARNSASEDNCVTRLVPLGDADSNGEIHASAELVGCYSTYAEALAVASGDSGSGASRHVTRDTPGVTLGTEWARTDYTGNSNTYQASSGCNNNTWTVDDLGSWNNTFQSGKGFGACNSNHKYAGQNETGDSLHCTPNCNDYGSLNQRVSSLKWHA